MPIEWTREGPWVLPHGWVWARLGDVTEVNPPTTFDGLPEDVELPFLPMAAVSEETGLVDYSQTRPIHELRSGYTRYRSNDVIFAKITPCMENGKIATITDLPHGYGAGSTEFHVLRPKAIDREYLRYWLVRRAFRDDARRNMSGSAGQLRVPVSYLREAPVAVPPAPEQRRIVSAINALLAEVADGEVALSRAKSVSDLWRSALLNSAVRGELTSAWRAKNIPEFTGVDIVEALRRDTPRQLRGRWAPPPGTRLLPSGWTWCAVVEAGDVQLGRQRAPQHHVGDHMRPYLRVANVFEGRLDLNDVKTMNFTPAEYETFALKPGDILLNEGQSPDLLGRPAIYRGEIPGCCFQKTLLRFRAREGILPEYALVVFRHYMRSGRFKKEARITTNMAHLTQVRFVAMEFPVPPPAEQAEIAARVQALEAEATDVIDGVAQDAIEALRQSILKAAFEGRLVPQDPEDEPADLLLSRSAGSVPAAVVPSQRRTLTRAAR